MVRKTRVRRSVATQGVKKYKVTKRSVKHDIFEYIEKLIPKEYVGYSYKISERCFHFIVNVCCTLSIAPISIDCDRKLTATQTTRQHAIHYCALTLQICRMLHMFAATTQRAIGGVLDLTFFVCLGSGLAYAVTYCIAASVLFRPYETAQLINSTPVTLSYYPKHGKVTTMFQNVKNTILVIFITFMVGSLSLLTSVFGLVVDDCPVSLYHVAESMIGRPVTSPLLWKLFYWPLELLMFLHAITLGGFGTMIITTIPNVVLNCTQQMREKRVTSEASRENLREKYQLLQVYLRLVNSWVKFMIVPTIFSVSSSIIIAFFVTLRYTDIPFLIYLGVALMGFSFLVLLFWFGFEVLTVIQATEAIVGSLKSQDQPYFLQLPLGKRLYLSKAGKATRPASFDIADFTDYSIGVLTNIWDEIINQLVFLLTL